MERGYREGSRAERGKEFAVSLGGGVSEDTALWALSFTQNKVRVLENVWGWCVGTRCVKACTRPSLRHWGFVLRGRGSRRCQGGSATHCRRVNEVQFADNTNPFRLIPAFFLSDSAEVAARNSHGARGKCSQRRLPLASP